MLPEIPEQRQIGAYFRQLDNLITLHQREQIFINLEVHDVRSGKKHRFIL
jgi:restriction endonuclease S subunit